MNRMLLGVIVGGVLGIVDGLTALVSAPETAPVIMSIVIGSAMKGLLVGLLVGWFARGARPTRAVMLFGLAMGAFFAFLVAAIPNPQGGHYWWEIMLPGSVVGLIVGYVTQKYGRPSMPSRA